MIMELLCDRFLQSIRAFASLCCTSWSPVLLVAYSPSRAENERCSWGSLWGVYYVGVFNVTDFEGNSEVVFRKAEILEIVDLGGRLDEALSGVTDKEVIHFISGICMAIGDEQFLAEQGVLSRKAALNYLALKLLNAQTLARLRREGRA
jgi:hypothetical protein